MTQLTDLPARDLIELARFYLQKDSGTPLPDDIAIELSNRLDCAVVAINQATKDRDALLAENTQLKLSREILAKNALETCNDLFSAGYHNASLKRGFLASTGNRNKYPAPIKVMVDEAIKGIETTTTDAYQAEAGRQAVNSFITFLQKRAEEFPRSVVADSLDVIIVNAEQYSYSQQLCKESGQ